MSVGSAMPRSLGLRDAVVIGLGSMIGAGVFSAFGPATRSAGSWLFVALALAAVVAFCNATSSAQLAARYPVSGGTYVYGRERLGPWWGFVAGWSFVVGKTASCAAMALTIAAYTVPAPWQRPVAIVVVAGLGLIGYRGITRTALAARVIVAVVLVALAVVVAAGIGASVGTTGGGVDPAGDTTSPYGVLQAAGLLFFAFAGYARIATLGEEVRSPRTVIPLAIVIALAITVVVYAAVALSIIAVLGVDGVASSSAPLFDAVREGGGPGSAPFIAVGAVAASIGALLALLAGVSRTTLAMAREGDLPRVLSAVHPRFGVPHRAELAITASVIGLVAVVDLRGAIGFSSFGVLLYYLVANIAAWTQPVGERRYPRVLQMLGAIACVVLVVTLPLPSIIGGVVVVVAGVACRLLSQLRARGES